MISVYAIRHGQAKPDFSDDFSRELTSHGQNTLARLGDQIRTDCPELDLVLASSAKRTMESANCLGFTQEVTALPELYLATAEEISDVLATVDLRFKNIALIGHNPGISDFLSQLGFVAMLDTGQCVLLQALSIEHLLAGVLINAKIVDNSQ